jgi:hypothetical protein
MYRYDASYAVEVQRAHPERFAIVKPVDPDDPGVADVIADWKKTPGAVGIRIMMTKEAQRKTWAWTSNIRWRNGGRSGDRYPLAFRFRRPLLWVPPSSRTDDRS